MANATEPVVATVDGGKSWMPLGQGLRSEQVSGVYAAPGGWWAALAHGGLMRFDSRNQSWLRAGILSGEAAASPTPSPGPRPALRTPKNGPRQLDAVVHDMAFASDRWFAATENGLLVSGDRGTSWMPEPLGPLATLPVQSVRVSADDRRLWVVSLRGLVFSTDGGQSWAWHDLPPNAGGALDLEAVRPEEDTLICIARNGLYISRDAGKSWQEPGTGLPSAPVRDFAVAGRVIVAAMRTGGLFASADLGRTWTRLAGTLADGYFSAVATGSEPGAIYAASATDGLYAVEWSPTSPQ
jgi:photosystem II stability/assembly factor-like uncharacterized protein